MLDTPENLDNGALLEKIKDLANLVHDDSARGDIQDYASEIYRLAELLETRESFHGIKDARD